jgi:histidyl-tRNA synthetase
VDFSTVKGFKDILPSEVTHWQRLEAAARRMFFVYGFQEIKTPLLERTELFRRSIGQDTDIVSKEMYSLQSSKGESLTLRPEATASVVRAYIQHRLYQRDPIQKLFTTGPMFRHERPQKGRFRQFHQVNAELFGDPGPRSDADIVTMAMVLLQQVGLEDLRLNLNSLGCGECRPRFREEIQVYFRDRSEMLCPDCRRRTDTNPLRVFDCKVEGCKEVVSGAPSILEFICGACQTHFGALQRHLDSTGLPYVRNPNLVRGLDYYCRTTFEIQSEKLGAQNAVAGGGRYDGLVKLLGGPDHPAIGFAVGMERAVTLLEEGDGSSRGARPQLFIAALGERAGELAFQWTTTLRKKGLWVEMDYGDRGLKSQMKRADRLGAPRVLIVGEDELASGKGILRDMGTKAQGEVELRGVLSRLEEVLKTNE